MPTYDILSKFSIIVGKMLAELRIPVVKIFGVCIDKTYHPRPGHLYKKSAANQENRSRKLAVELSGSSSTYK